MTHLWGAVQAFVAAATVATLHQLAVGLWHL